MATKIILDSQKSIWVTEDQKDDLIDRDLIWGDGKDWFGLQCEELNTFLLDEIKSESNKFELEMTRKLNELCNIIDFKKSSHLSHIGDRLTLFITELNEFKN